MSEELSTKKQVSGVGELRRRQRIRLFDISLRLILLLRIIWATFYCVVCFPPKVLVKLFVHVGNVTVFEGEMRPVS